MRACLFGTYNREHSANRIYAQAIGAAGFDLVEYHQPLWERTRDKGRAYFRPLGLALRAAAWALAALRLSWRWFGSGGTPVAVVGFNGQLDVLLLRLISLRRGPRIVFAPLVSITETLVDDRGVYRRGTLAARVLAWVDRLACAAADVVVLDSDAHRQYFIDVLGVEPSRLVVCYLGADSSVFDPHSPLAAAGSEASKPAGEPGEGPGETRDKVKVLYFGQYLPLHGLDVIADAVARLASRDDLRFVFVGTGEQREAVEPRIRASRADVEFLDWVDYEELPELILGADIVLGVFGSSVKARMVIPNKVYEAAAVGRAIISADTPAMREVFSDGRNVVLCEPHGTALAEAIASLADTAAYRRSLGEAANALMKERFDQAALGRDWAWPLAEERPTAPGSEDDGGELDESALPEPLVGAVILNFNCARESLRCLASLVGGDYGNLRVIVVDNASEPEDRRILEEGMAGRFDARLDFNDSNLGYARANNLAMAKLFAEGCEQVLILNGDTVLSPGAVLAMVECSLRNPHCGPLGPRVARDWPGARTASIGERYWAPLVWMPRSLLRPRRPRQRSYQVSGVLGCAMMINRDLYNRIGGFDEAYFAYYEEVDYCLRARRLGMPPRVEPGAEIAHSGHRGFGSGMTVVAAYLKARNLWRLGARRLDPLGMLVFAPGYFAMTGASMLGYLLRGRLEIVRAMARGLRAGIGGESGPPPDWVLAGVGLDASGR